MPASPRLAAVLLLPLLAACATTAPGTPDPRLAALVARLPAQVMGFDLTESVPTGEAQTGWKARYAHAASGSTASVMLDLPGNASLPEGPDSPQVRAMVNSLSLLVQAQTGGGGLTRSPDFSAGITGQPPAVRCADMLFRESEAMARRILVCVTGAGGGLVTAFTTGRHKTEDADGARAFMTAFVLETLQALRGEPAAVPSTPTLPPAGGRVFRL